MEHGTDPNSRSNAGAVFAGRPKCRNPPASPGNNFQPQLPPWGPLSWAPGLVNCQGGQDHLTLRQPGVLGFRLPVDRDVGISVLPEFKKILVPLACGRDITRYFLRSRQLQT